MARRYTAAVIRASALSQRSRRTSIAPMSATTATGLRTLLHHAADHAATYLEGDAERPVRPEGGADALAAAFAGPLPETGSDPHAVLDDLVARSAPGLTAMTSPRFFGFVVGGTLPAALVADWMAVACDQTAGLAEPSPAVAAAEATAGGWVQDLLGLP